MKANPPILTAFTNKFMDSTLKVGLPPITKVMMMPTPQTKAVFVMFRRERVNASISFVILTPFRL